MMNLQRATHLVLTALPRAIHRRGYGIHSPWAYELVRDVLFERHQYYAYQEQHMNAQQQQLYRICNHYRNQPVVIIDQKAQAAAVSYEEAVQHANAQTVLIVEHIHNDNAALWQHIVNDPRAIVTFDMRRRGLVTFDNKRIKQNYLL